MKSRKYTEQQFVDAVKNNISIAAVLKILNLSPTGANYKTFHRTIKQFNLDISHFTGSGHLKNKHHNWNIKIPLNEILIKDSTYSTSSHLRKRLILEKIFEEKCSQCGIMEWQNKKIPLQLDHINGDHLDNRIENLRLLCPNCHSLTDTYCVKNRKITMPKQEIYCTTCNKLLRQKRKSGKCIKCCKTAIHGPN